MKTEDQGFKKRVDETKKIGDFLGNRCEAPILSMFEGNYSFFPGLVMNGLTCYNKGKYLEKMAYRHPTMLEPLRNVFLASSKVGACRFWQEHQQPIPAECSEADALLERAEAECYAEYARTKK